MLSCVQLFAPPLECILPRSSVRGFFRQEYWSGLLFPTPVDNLDPSVESAPPTLAGGFWKNSNNDSW